jgi:transposase
LFTGSCNTATVNTWLEEMLLPELENPSVIVMDNARFHNKAQMQEILEKAGHTMLPLPRYSPDFNPIEQSFATLKKRNNIGTATYVIFLNEITIVIHHWMVMRVVS